MIYSETTEGTAFELQQGSDKNQCKQEMRVRERREYLLLTCSVLRQLCWRTCVLLCALSCTTTQQDNTKKTSTFSPKGALEYSDKLKKYVQALILFDSDLEADWNTALGRINLLGDFSMSEDEPDLISKALKSQDARKELARRGKMIKLLETFFGTNTNSWARAHKELISLGEDAKGLLTSALFHSLMQESRRLIWDEIRRHLVALNPVNATRDLINSFIEIAPADVIRWEHSERLTQLLILSLELKLDDLIKISKNKISIVRQCVAHTIAMKQVHLEILQEYLLKDKDIDVRNAVVMAISRVRSKDYLKLLIDSAKSEKDEFLLKSIVEGLAAQRESEAVETLVKLLDNESDLVVTATIESLFRITGKKLRTVVEWKEWWKNGGK